MTFQLRGTASDEFYSAGSLPAQELGMARLDHLAEAV
jgi:hypothetical protein